MITALVLPALVAPLAAVAPAAATHASARADGYVTSASAPALYVVGEPYIVDLEIRAQGDKAVSVPTWLLSPAAWLVDKKPLSKREGKADFTLQPGQALRSEIDLSPGLQERFDGAAKDFKIRCTEVDGVPTEVFALQPVGELPNFETIAEDALANYQVVLETTGGPVWVEVWPDVAPNHVRNFLDLCASGFYEGSAFHRVIPGFMIQGGQSKEGTPAPRKLEAEFNSRKHTAGVLSAARLGNDINSATSEFFLVHETSPHLDGNYTGFGRVIFGMDSVDRIVDSVSVHHQLVEELAKKGVRLSPRNPAVAVAMNSPNPAQAIERATVVEASKSRPRNNR